jgi:hypothetical protein
MNNYIKDLMIGDPKNLKALLLAFPIVAVILVSGCTDGGSTISFGPGVQIVTWEPDLKTTSYNSDDQVKLLLKIQNTGEYDARDVTAQLFGININDWGGIWSDYETLGDLLAADEQYGTEGESKTHRWILDAPGLPKGTDLSYTPTVRVAYDYKTVAIKPITIVDRDELMRLIQDGRSIPGESTTYTHGPLSVQITTGNFVKTERRDPYFPIHISVRNSGTGLVSEEGSYGVGGWDELDYPVDISVKLPSTMNIVGGQDCSSSGSTVEMWQGDEAEITCEVAVDDVEISQKEVIRVDVNYRYEIDASTTVRVIGEGQDYW